MKTEIIRIELITEPEKRELFCLFRQFYANTDYARFLSDLDEKNWLIRMSENGTLAGFSTQQLIEIPLCGNPVHFLFSGDTIVHPNYWNRSHLAGAFGHLFQHLLPSSPAPLYWFLISKGFRTYRFLPVFFKKFYPIHTKENLGLKPLLDAVASHKFGSAYCSKTEVVDLNGTKDCLSEEFADIPDSRKNNRHIEYFLQRNPDYRAGTELAGIAPLFDNLTRCGQRVIQTTQVEWHV